MCAVEFAAWALCCLQVKLFLIHDVFMNSNGFTCIEQCVNQGTHLACIWVVSNGSWSQRRQIQNFSDFSFQNWYCLWLFWLQLPTYKWLNLNAGIRTLDFNFTASALPPKSAKMLVSMCLQLFVCVTTAATHTDTSSIFLTMLVIFNLLWPTLLHPVYWGWQQLSLIWCHVNWMH